MPRVRKENVDEFLDTLPETLRRPVEQLRMVQKKCESIKDDYNKELKALNAKYQQLYDPVYDKRAEIIRGIGHGDNPTVSGFWLKVFLSSATVGAAITKADEEILKFLFDVRCEPIGPDGNGFHLKFKFETNPFFLTSELRKTYYLEDEDDHLLTSTKGCKIDWLPHRNPKHKTIWKKGKRNAVESESFFDFFDPPQLPDSDAGSGELDLERIHNIQEAIEEDFDIGLVIKDMLIPNAVSWFTGEIVEVDSSGDDSSYDGTDRDTVTTVTARSSRG